MTKRQEGERERERDIYIYRERKKDRDIWRERDREIDIVTQISQDTPLDPSPRDRGERS